MFIRIPCGEKAKLQGATQTLTCMQLILLLFALCGTHAFNNVFLRRASALPRVSMRSSGDFFPFTEVRADTSLSAKNVDDTLSESKSWLVVHSFTHAAHAGCIPCIAVPLFSQNSNRPPLPHHTCFFSSDMAALREFFFAGHEARREGETGGGANLETSNW